MFKKDSKKKILLKKDELQMIENLLKKGYIKNKVKAMNVLQQYYQKLNKVIR